MKEKIGIVDVGGGLRGIYAAGILDRCLDEGIRFDLGIGVSAGSANLASFLAGQSRRNYKFYTEYAMRKQYMSVHNYLKNGSFIDLDYVYSGLSNSDGEYPLDYPAIARNPMEFYVVAEEADTATPTYFTKADMRQDCYDICKASSAIPFVCKPYFIDGKPYYDGALADPVPVEKAFSLGCDRVVLILTLPLDHERKADRDLRIADRIRKRYPKAAIHLMQRAAKYNRSVKRAKELAQEGKVLILAPDDTYGIGTLSRDVEGLRHFYEKGYEDASRIPAFLG